MISILEKETTLEGTSLTSMSTRELLDIKSLPITNSCNHFSMNSNAVYEFDPSSKEQSVDIWINNVEEYAKLYDWNEPQLLYYTLLKLMRVAKI